jgi:uncharacterized membrane protein
MTLPEFTILDYAALGWFLACWIGYSIFADYSRWKERSTTAIMSGYRRQWMQVMLRRENRIVDTNILGNLQNGVAFFASTTIFAIGGMLAMLGAGDVAVQIIADLPFAVETSRLTWELKALLLVMTLVFAFFKFARAFRLYNYCSVLIGAAPAEVENNPEAEALAERAAGINSLAARHFNRGIRAYFFALAALSWFLHPVLFIAAAAWVVFVVYRREFRSRSLEIIADKPRLARGPVPPRRGP